MVRLINESALDRTLRTTIGIVLVVSGFYTSPALSVVLFVLGAIALATGISGFCPLYKLFRISTRKPS